MEAREILTEGELFRKVQQQGLFHDCKIFVDSVPIKNPEKIIDSVPSEDLKQFVQENFDLPENKEVEGLEDLDIHEYIHEAWNFLQRTDAEDTGTYLRLENSYIVPGGRFRELYYWDSYFTMLGLQQSGKTEIMNGMIENFASQIEKHDFIPNGNRTYYLDRSQPPFFGEMLKILMDEEDFSEASKFLPQLEKEYSFWMDSNREVEVNGVELNRYWSSKERPRPESFREDMEVKEASDRGKEIFRDIRASCESGWDFSTRWTDGDLKSVHTTDFLAVDLNSIMYGIERQIEEWNRRKDNEEKAEKFRIRADRREKAFNSCFWSDEKGFYFDYDTANDRASDSWTLAGVFPLYFEIASDRQAEKVAETLEEKFLSDGGLKTTLDRGLQWDSPNGWPPLQYMAVKGLLNYGQKDLARKISRRWLDTCRKVYSENGVMLEKYNVERPTDDVFDGEYSNQIGFGWTNGVFLALENLDL